MDFTNCQNIEILCFMCLSHEWDLFAGIQNNNEPILEWIWPQEWRFIYIIKSCKPGKAHMNKNINPAKVRVHSPSKGQVKPMGRKGEKIFSK